MMLRQGWAFETSPHGASQTIFRPGMSGVPDIRAVVARSGDCASAGENNETTQSAVASRRKLIDGASGESPSDRVSGELAQGQFRHQVLLGRQRWRHVIHRM